MSGKDKFDFIVGIVKSGTSTRQAEDDPHSVTEQFCDSCTSSSKAMSNFFLTSDTEVREQPPKKSPPPPPKPKQMSASSSSSKSRGDRRTLAGFDYYGNPIEGKKTVGFDFYGNPIEKKTQQAPRQPPGILQKRESYSEFLEVNPTAAAQEQCIRDADIDESCMAEFGRFLLCRGPPTEKEQEQMDMMDEIKNQLQSMRKSTLNEASTSNALLELELQAELSNVRQQREEMEKYYRQQINREVSERVRLQAQLQQKLLSVTQSRMLLELQLGELANKIPTAMLMNQPHENCSPLSVGDVVSPQKSEPSDPPTQSRMPAEPPATTAIVLASETVSTGTPKKASATDAYALSIVVESSDSSCDPEGTTGEELASPTGNRSPAEGGVNNLASPTYNRSPSSTFIPVATPVGAATRFQAAE